MRHMKTILFFDADGTLWYPKKTRYKEKPWWIYNHPKLKSSDPLKHLTLMPHVKETLKKLDDMGLILVLISQLPYNKKVALQRLIRMTKHFDIYKFFDEIRPSYSSIKKGHPDPKNIAILDVLERRKISKRNALMIGDSYEYDYLAAKSCGIGCVLIYAFKHVKDDKKYKRVHNKIKKLNEVLKYI